jgi:uncharacterized protein (DUF433 family)
MSGGRKRSRKAQRRLGFRGTRVPVAAVFENLEDGLTINEIVQMFDGLSKDLVVTVLEFAAQSLEVPLLAR